MKTPEKNTVRSRIISLLTNCLRCASYLLILCLAAGSVIAQPISNNSRVLIIGPAAPTHASALQSLINGDATVSTRGITVDHLETDILITKVCEGWGDFVGGAQPFRPVWSPNALLKKLDLNFDLVVINPDREILLFPEYFMEAVRLIKRYAEARGSEVALIVPPHSSTQTMYQGSGVSGFPAQFPANNATMVKEQVYRIADALDLPVVPAGLTWRQLELDPAITTPAFPSYSYSDSGTRPTHYNPDVYMVNVYATTLYSALFEASPAQSTFRYGGISNTDFTKVSNYAFQTWQSALTATHYTGPFLGPLSPVVPTAELPNLLYDPTRKYLVNGYSTEGFTMIEFGNIFTRIGMTIAGQEATQVSGVEYEFLLGRSIAYGNRSQVGLSQEYKYGRIDRAPKDPTKETDGRFHNITRVPNMRENPSWLAFTRLWVENVPLNVNRVGDGHLSDAAHMLMGAGNYAIMTGGKHPFLDDNADLIRWTGPQRLAASIGWGAVMGPGRLAKLKSPPVATAIPRIKVPREVASAVTLTGFDFDGLPMTAEIVTPPSHGSLVPTGTSGLNFTYTPAAGFDGLDTVTYRVVNANGVSQPLTIDFNVGPYQPLPVAGTVIFSENFEDQEISDWSVSGVTGIVTSSSYPQTYNGDPMPYDGSAGLRVQSFSTVEKAINTTAFTNVQLTVRMGVGDQRIADWGPSGGNSKFFAQFEWYDGTTWRSVITNAITQRNNYLLQTYQVPLPAGAANNANFKIRLRANTSGSTWTNAFFDSIVLTGDATGAPGNTYSVLYNANGATSGTAPAAQSKTQDEALNLGANTGNLARTGYNFAGWNTAADGSGTSYVAGTSYTTNASVTLYAKWTPNATTYTVTYNANGATSGTAPAAQSKTRDVTLTVVGNTGSLVRTGYNFVVWNTAADGSGTSYAAGTSYTVNAAVTLYAKWTTTSNTATYPVSYLANGATGGTAPAAQTKTHNVALTLAANPGNLVRTGYTFAGWDDNSGMIYAPGAIYTINTSVVLYAKWTPNATTYSVNYNANGATSGTAPAAQTKTHDVALTLATNTGNLTRTGFTFAGWNTAANGSGTSYNVGAGYTANAAVTLYARWTPNTYAVTYNANGATSGTAPANQTKTHDVALTLATNSGNLTKTGSTFAGWNTAANGTGTNYAVGASYTGNAALTLYAKYGVPPVVNAGPDQVVMMSGAAPWTPASVSGLTGWYDASDAATLTQSGGAVSQWVDKSGKGLHLNQSTAASQPRTGINTINGRTAVKFDGTNDTMVTATNPFASTIQNAFVIAVHRIDATTNGTLFSLSGSATQRWQSHAPWSGVAYFDTGGSTGANRISSNYGVAVGDNVLVGFYGSATDNVQQIFKNGSLLIGDATGHSATTAGNIFVGSGVNEQYQNTSIGEFIIVNSTVSVENRQKLEGYLAHKWGLQANLPAAHTYKSAAPGGTGVTVSLDGTVTVSNGTPTTTWSVHSGPAAASFANASAVDTTATFTKAGTYVLRLSANDGTAQVFDEVTITMIQQGAIVDSNTNSIDDTWETVNFGGLFGVNQIMHESGVPYYFMYLHGTDLGNPSDRFRVAVEPKAGGSDAVFAWEVLPQFQLGLDYDIRISTNLTQWDPLPAEHFTLDQTTVGSRSRIELTLTHDYGQKAFLRIQKP